MADPGRPDGPGDPADDGTGGHGVDVALVLLVYVLPLALVTVLLFLADLAVLAVGLLVVEACVVTATVLARRRPARPVGGVPSRRPWLVPVVMLVGLLAIVGLSFLGMRTG